MRRHHDRAMQHVRQPDVVDIAGTSGQETLVLDAQDRLTDAVAIHKGLVSSEEGANCNGGVGGCILPPPLVDYKTHPPSPPSPRAPPPPGLRRPPARPLRPLFGRLCSALRAPCAR